MFNNFIFQFRRGRMEVSFTTIYAISAYHHKCYDLEPRTWRGLLDTALCD
jgi:hypothetical protein